MYDLKVDNSPKCDLRWGNTNYFHISVMIRSYIIGLIFSNVHIASIINSSDLANALIWAWKFNFYNISS